MAREKMRHLKPSFLLLLLCVLFTGCGSDAVSSKLAALNKENIQKASTLYSIYSSSNNFTGPASKEEMLEFMRTDAGVKKRLDFVGIQISQLEDYLVGRDGEPLEFRWSVKTAPMAPPYPICFEQTGVDGVRQVGISGAKIVECTDDDHYEQLKKGIYKPEERVRYTPTIESEEITPE